MACIYENDAELRRVGNLLGNPNLKLLGAVLVKLNIDPEDITNAKDDNAIKVLSELRDFKSDVSVVSTQYEDSIEMLVDLESKGNATGLSIYTQETGEIAEKMYMSKTRKSSLSYYNIIVDDSDSNKKSVSKAILKDRIKYKLNEMIENNTELLVVQGDAITAFNVSQNYLDNLVLSALYEIIHENYYDKLSYKLLNIKIVLNGDSGIEEAFIKAAMSLNIPLEIKMLKDLPLTTKKGDILRDSKAFFGRFSAYKPLLQSSKRLGTYTVDNIQDSFRKTTSSVITFGSNSLVTNPEGLLTLNALGITFPNVVPFEENLKLFHILNYHEDSKNVNKIILDAGYDPHTLKADSSVENPFTDVKDKRELYNLLIKDTIIKYIKDKLKENPGHKFYVSNSFDNKRVVDLIRMIDEYNADENNTDKIDKNAFIFFRSTTADTLYNVLNNNENSNHTLYDHNLSRKVESDAPFYTRLSPIQQIDRVNYMARFMIEYVGKYLSANDYTILKNMELRLKGRKKKLFANSYNSSTVKGVDTVIKFKMMPINVMLDLVVSVQEKILSDNKYLRGWMSLEVPKEQLDEHVKKYGELRRSAIREIHDIFKKEDELGNPIFKKMIVDAFLDILKVKQPKGKFSSEFSVNEDIDLFKEDEVTDESNQYSEKDDEFHENTSWEDKSTSAEQTATRELKAVLESLQDNTLDDIGYPKKMGVKKAFAILINNLYHYDHPDDMVQGLKTLTESYPQFSPLLNKINHDSSKLKDETDNSSLKGALFNALSRVEENFIKEFKKETFNRFEGFRTTQGLMPLTSNLDSNQVGDVWMLEYHNMASQRNKDKFLEELNKIKEKTSGNLHITSNLAKAFDFMGIPEVTEKVLDTYFNTLSKDEKQDFGISVGKVLYNYDNPDSKKIFRAISRKLFPYLDLAYKEASVKVGDKMRYRYTNPYFLKTILNFLTNKKGLTGNAFVQELHNYFGVAKGQYTGTFKVGDKQAPKVIYYNPILRYLHEEALKAGDKVFSPKDNRNILDSSVMLRNLEDKEFKDWSEEDHFHVLFNAYAVDRLRDVTHYGVPVYAENKNLDLVRFINYNDEKDFRQKAIDSIAYSALGELSRIATVLIRKGLDVQKIKYFDTGNGEQFLLFPELEQHKEELLKLFNENIDNQGVVLDEIKKYLPKIMGDRFEATLKYLHDRGIDIRRSKGLKYSLKMPNLNTVKVHLSKLELEVKESNNNRLTEEVIKIKSLLRKIEESYDLESYYTKKELIKYLEEYVYSNTNQKGNSNAELLLNSLKEINHYVIEDIEMFFYNNTNFRLGIIGVTSVDPAFYDSKVGFQKRNKQIRANMNRLDITALKSYNPETRQAIEKSLAIGDIEMQSSNYDTLMGIYKGSLSKYFSKQEIDVLSDNLKSINTTDGQSFRTLESYIDILKAVGKFGLIRGIYPKIKAKLAGEDVEFEKGEVFTFFQAIKPYAYGHMKLTYDVNGTENTIISSIQHKNSESPLLALLELFPNDVIPTYAPIINIMKEIREYNKKNPSSPIDVIHFTSATKTGTLANAATIADDISEKSIEALVNDPNNYQYKDYANYGIQVETPEHLLDHSMGLGSQLKKIMVSGLTDDFKTTLSWHKDKNGKLIEIGKKEILDEYAKLLAQRARIEYDKLTELFGSIENVRQLLVEEITNNPEKYPRDIIKSLDIITVDGKKRFRVPLFDPVNRRDFNNLIQSIIRKRIAKHEISGGTAVLTSSVVVGQDLKVEFDGNRVKYVEAYLPAYYKELIEDSDSYDKKTGTIKVDGLDENILKVIGYRVPTEDKYSIVPIKIKGFLPNYVGSTILLPHDYIEWAGWDHDIDKIYILMPHIIRAKQRSKEGKIERTGKYKVNYRTGDSISNLDEHQVNNRLIAIMHAMLTSTDAAPKMINKGGFEEIKSVGNKIDNYISGVINGRAEEFSKVSDKSLNTSLPEYTDFTYDMYFRNQNQVGLQLVSITALHNAHHAFIQDSETFFNIGVTINGKKLTSLTRKTIKYKEGEEEKEYFTTKKVSEFLAGAKKSSKNSTLEKLGVTVYNGNIFLTFIRLGYSAEELALIFRQPSIVKLSKEQLSEDKIKKEYDTILKLILKSKKYGTDKKRITSNYVDKIALGNTAMLDSLKYFHSGEMSMQYYAIQLKVLQEFSTMLKMSNKLNSLISLSRFDAAHRSIGRSPHNIIIDAIDIDDFYSEEDINDEILMSNTLVSNRISPSFIKMLIDKGSIFPQDIARFIMQAYYTFGKAAADKFYSMYSIEHSPAVSELIRFVKDNKFAAEDADYNKIIFDFITYYMSGLKEFSGSNGFTTQEKRIDYKKNFPYLFQQIKFNDKYKDINKLEIIKMLVVTDINDEKVITFPNIDKVSKKMMYQYSAEWESLLDMKKYGLTKDDTVDAIGKDLAYQLFIYSFYKSGLGFSYNGFMHLAPVKLRYSIEGYVDKLYRSIDSTKTSSLVANFLEQFKNNNPEYNKYYFTKDVFYNSKGVTATNDIVTINPYEFDKYRDYELITKFKYDKNTNERIYPEYIYVGDDVLKLYITDGNNAIYMPYTKTSNRNISLQYDINAEGIYKSDLDNNVDHFFSGFDFDFSTYEQYKNVEMKEPLCK